MPLEVSLFSFFFFRWWHFFVCSFVFALNESKKSIAVATPLVLNRDLHTRIAEHKGGDDLGILTEY